MQYYNYLCFTITTVLLYPARNGMRSCCLRKECQTLNKFYIIKWCHFPSLSCEIFHLSGTISLRGKPARPIGEVILKTLQCIARCFGREEKLWKMEWNVKGYPSREKSFPTAKSILTRIRGNSRVFRLGKFPQRYSWLNPNLLINRYLFSFIFLKTYGFRNGRRLVYFGTVSHFIYFSLTFFRYTVIERCLIF